MSNKIRGFEVLDEFKSKVIEIMKSDPDSYGIMEDQVERLSSDYGHEDYWLPRRETPGSAGYDIRSIENITVGPGECKLVGTGLTAYMQNDEELQIRPRSGNARKHLITVLNTPGTIDSDYYGKHIGVLIMNFGNSNFDIKAGDRIAQGVFSKYLIKDDDNPVNDTRDGGFGSTGRR